MYSVLIRSLQECRAAREVCKCVPCKVGFHIHCWYVRSCTSWRGEMMTVIMTSCANYCHPWSLADGGAPPQLRKTGSDNLIIEKPFINQSLWKGEAPPPLPLIHHCQTPSLGWNNSERKEDKVLGTSLQWWERVGFESGMIVGSCRRRLLFGRNPSNDWHHSAGMDAVVGMWGHTGAV